MEAVAQITIYVTLPQRWGYEHVVFLAGIGALYEKKRHGIRCDQCFVEVLL
jgi:hypothetical protein